ncbi:MAG TPA: hypothetical protein VGP62_29690 [Bryobacteraceae bacterium]|jgi:hypothetical protein|nr:hypothetical protein [Bryobacteraceae bacterium]
MTVLRSGLAFGALALCAIAADAFYLGTWKIESAVVAPWWTERTKPDAAEMTGLVGKTMVITPTGISGPRQLACKGPKYELKEYPADMLFQGMLGEMHERDKSVDPGKVAATLGFRGSSWKTVETGCGNEIDFHFIDALTATFGLNNYIYTLKKR